jgi:hypothetical protein
MSGCGPLVVWLRANNKAGTGFRDVLGYLKGGRLEVLGQSGCSD